MPKVRQHFEDRLISKNKTMLKHLDQANKVYIQSWFKIFQTVYILELKIIHVICIDRIKYILSYNDNE